MTRPQDHDDLDALTDRERDALAAFDDFVDARCAPEHELESQSSEEGPMRTHPFKLTQLVTAAGILAALVSLTAVFWQNQDQKLPQDATVLEFLSEQETQPRLTFLIGLGSTGSDKPIELKRWVGGGARHLEIFNEYEPFKFDQKVADAQRAEAITKGKEKKGGYRDGDSYQLLDKKGKPLPVYWKAWAPGVTARRLDVSLEDAAAALKAARAGKPFSADLVQGGWVYSPPDWYGPLDPKGFSEKDLSDVRAADDPHGGRAVFASVKKDRQDAFHTFTTQFVDQALCLVVDDVIWANPVVREALRGAIMITGGGAGFDEREQTYVVGALRGTSK